MGTIHNHHDIKNTLTEMLRLSNNIDHAVIINDLLNLSNKWGLCHSVWLHDQFIFRFVFNDDSRMINPVLQVDLNSGRDQCYYFYSDVHGSELQTVGMDGYSVDYFDKKYRLDYVFNKLFEVVQSRNQALNL